jgi:hypothetical protein
MMGPGSNRSLRARTRRARGRTGLPRPGQPASMVENPARGALKLAKAPFVVSAGTK